MHQYRISQLSEPKLLVAALPFVHWAQITFFISLRHIRYVPTLRHSLFYVFVALVTKISI